MDTNKIESESESVVKIEMAFENIKRYEFSISRPTTEEHESKKKEFADQVSKELIDSFSPEDRLDIFNYIRRNLERDLESKVYELNDRIENDKRYFEAYRNIIY